MNNFQSHSHLVATGPSVEARSLPGLEQLNQRLSDLVTAPAAGLVGIDTESDGFALLFKTDELAALYANSVNRMLIANAT